MAFYIRPKEGSAWISFYLRDKPFLHLGIYPNDILELEADKDELAYVRKKLINIPDCPNAKIVRWFGETARFIYQCLIRN